MAILDLLKRTKKRIDDAIPDFNLTQKAGNVLRQANQIRQNLPIAQEGRRLTDMLAAQRERQAEQARLKQEREIQARERRMEESRRRMEEMRAKDQERNRQREENQRKLREATSAVGKFAANIPQEIGAGLLRSGAIAADTGVKALQKGEDIITAPLGKKYKERLTKLRQVQSKKEDELLGRLQTQELKKGEGAKNYLRETFNKALPEIKNVKQSTPLQRGAAVADIGLTLLAPGVGNVLKEAGKQGAKQVAKQYAKTAALGAAGGASGAATMKDATAKDIATGAVGGAVFGAGLKGAGDVAPVVVRKAGSTLSKTKEGIASALQEPKFKPGFASTKPKKGLEPTQPKVDSIKTSAQQAKAEGKTFDEWVKKQGTNVYHGTNIKNAKMLKSKPRLLTPEEQNIYPTTVVGDTQIGVSTSKDKNISEYFASLQPTGKGEVLDFVLPKNAKIYKLPENVDAIDNLGLKELQRIKKLGYDAIEDVKNIGGESEIRVISPEILKTREQLKAEWDATQSQPKFKKGFISLKGKKGLEPAQPIVKLQTETPAISKTSRQLAEEAVQRATKEPISPEIAPMARVSTKAEPSIPETIKTQGVKQDIPEIKVPESKVKKVEQFVNSVDPNDPFGNRNIIQRVKNELGSFVDSDYNLLSMLRRIENETGRKGLVDQFYFDAGNIRQSKSIANAKIKQSEELANAFSGLNKKTLNEFDTYVKAKAELENYTPDMKVSKDREVLANIVQSGDAKFADRFNQLNAYYKNMAQDMYDNGLIDKQRLDTYLANDNYVRLQRDMEDLVGVMPGKSGSRSIKSTSATQKRVGSERELLSPSKTLLNRTQQIELEIQRNIAANNIINTLEEFGLAKKVTKGTNKNTIGRLVNGKKELYKVSGDIKQVVESASPYNLGVVASILSAPTRLLRAGATGLSAPFTVVNYLRDQASSAIFSKKTLATHNPVNIITGLSNAVADQVKGNKSPLWKKFETYVGNQTVFDDIRNTANSNRMLRELTQGQVGRVKNAILDPIRTLEDFNAITEKATRFQNFEGIYKDAIKRGLSEEKAIQEAVLAARKGSVDFTRGSEYSRLINLFIPYFNAGLQGSRNVVQSFRQRPVGTTIKSLSFVALPTLASTAYNLSNEKSREAYNSIADYEKENNFIIVLPDVKQNKDGVWEGIIKIPKPQGYKELTDPLREVTEAYLQGESIENTQKMFYDMLGAISGPINIQSGRQFLGSITPQIIKPGLQAALNKDLFTGANIVPEYMIEQTEEPTKRKKEGTSGSARLLAEQLGISPLQVEKFIQGTAGGASQYVTNLVDTALANAGVISKNEIGGRSIQEDFSRRLFQARGDLLEQNKTPGQRYYENVKQATEGLSTQDKDAWNTIHPVKTNFLGEEVLDENKRISKYTRAGVYLNNPNVLEADRRLNQLQVEKGNPSNPLFELPTPLLTKVLLKDALPPGAKDPELSKLRDEEWYQNYLNARGKYYEQVKENLKLQGKEIPAQKNPYPTTPPQLQQAMDFYFDLPNSKAKSNWKKANPGLWEQMKAQWAQVDAWENKERVAIGLAETPTDETSGAVGKGKGGKGKKIKLAPVPKAKDTIEISRLKRQKLPTLRLATSRAKTPVLRLVKSTKFEPKKLTVRKIRVK